jgi:hypothetical protein
MSPGWHASTSQIASSVEKRIARALPVLRMEGDFVASWLQ